MIHRVQVKRLFLKKRRLTPFSKMEGRKVVIAKCIDKVV